mmetsp:Transcript_15384/g.49055  ORF Transcript_15384/g.49055 Transcript_15384/m.49055 type:complete len:414 (+) Transcript_15384:273-1514(+)
MASEEAEGRRRETDAGDRKVLRRARRAQDDAVDKAMAFAGASEEAKEEEDKEESRPLPRRRSSGSGRRARQASDAVAKSDGCDVDQVGAARPSERRRRSRRDASDTERTRDKEKHRQQLEQQQRKQLQEEEEEHQQQDRQSHSRHSRKSRKEATSDSRTSRASCRRREKGGGREAKVEDGVLSDRDDSEGKAEDDDDPATPRARPLHSVKRIESAADERRSANEAVSDEVTKSRLPMYDEVSCENSREVLLHGWAKKLKKNGSILGGLWNKRYFACEKVNGANARGHLCSWLRITYYADEVDFDYGFSGRDVDLRKIVGLVVFCDAHPKFKIATVDPTESIVLKFKRIREQHYWAAGLSALTSVPVQCEGADEVAWPHGIGLPPANMHTLFSSVPPFPTKSSKPDNRKFSTLL